MPSGGRRGHRCGAVRRGRVRASRFLGPRRARKPPPAPWRGTRSATPQRGPPGTEGGPAGRDRAGQQGSARGSTIPSRTLYTATWTRLFLCSFAMTRPRCFLTVASARFRFSAISPLDCPSTRRRSTCNSRAVRAAGRRPRRGAGEGVPAGRANSVSTCAAREAESAVSPRMAACRYSRSFAAGSSLEMYPTAPPRSAWKTSSPRLDMVSMTTRTWASVRQISRVAATPPTGCMRTSMSTRSGRRRRALRVAWAPSWAWPTTSNSGQRARSAAMPSRNRA